MVGIKLVDAGFQGIHRWEIIYGAEKHANSNSSAMGKGGERERERKREAIDQKE